MWKLLAKLLAKRPIADYLIRRSFRTPYFHLEQGDTGVVYMRRWWLFNPYDYTTRKTKYSWLPVSIRIHQICQKDSDLHMHDHPWDARTIILRGWYWEIREDSINHRTAGDTAALKFNEYHRIESVSEGGVWTMFITWKYRGTWGFKVDGKKVPYREYLNRE